MSAKPDLFMPKPDPVTGTDNLGIRYEGPVLSGTLGVTQQLERQAVSSFQTSAQIREMAPGGVEFVKPEVFCYQGRPIQPDPVYAYQRSQLPHPSLADPVLRHHLNLPPLPDPYEKRLAAERRRQLRDSGKDPVSGS